MTHVYIHADSEEIIQKTTPHGRKPGIWRRLVLIDSLETFNERFGQIYGEMGTYKAVGFDVECVNFKNAVTFPQLTQRQSGEAPSLDDLPPHLRLPLKIVNDKRSRKETSVLLQLATWSGFVLLVRLCYLNKIPEALRHFLADSTILKLGVGVEVDSCRLWHDWGMLVRGWLDLRHICVDLGVEFRGFSFARMGLKTLATTLFGEPKELGLTPVKMKKISFSDWTSKELSDDQLRYGAWDVQIAVDIFSFGTQKLFTINQPNVSDESYYNCLLKKCEKFIESPRFDEDLSVDEQIREDDCVKEEDNIEVDTLVKLLSKFKSITHGSDEEGVEKVLSKNILSSKIFSLRSVGEREIITADFDENLIRLYLPPSSTGEPICIICGETVFSKCSLVPIISPLYMYHCRLAVDCCCNEVWLCFECRNNWVRDSLRLTMELAIVFDAPLTHGSEKADVDHRNSLKKSMSTWNSKRKILKTKQRRQRECWREAAYDSGGGGLLSRVDDDSDCDNKTINDITSHEYVVMNQFLNGKDFVAFDQMWRRHFVELLHPQYLPHNWSTDHDATSCGKKGERKNHFLRKSVMFDDEVTTITTTNEKSSHVESIKRTEILTTADVDAPVRPRKSMVNMDDLFDYEEFQTNKIMQQNTDDRSAFDPLGFGHHVKSKQFDRKLYKKLMKEGDVTIQKYMDERSRDDEPNEYDDVPLPPIMILRGNGRSERRFRRPQYLSMNGSSLRRMHYVHPSNTIQRPSELYPIVSDGEPDEYDDGPLPPIMIMRGNARGERRFRRPKYSMNDSTIRRMHFMHPSNTMQRHNDNYPYVSDDELDEYDDVPLPPIMILRGNGRGERRFRRPRYAMNGSEIRRMHFIHPSNTIKRPPTNFPPSLMTSDYLMPPQHPQTYDAANR